MVRESRGSGPPRYRDEFFIEIFRILLNNIKFFYFVCSAKVKKKISFPIDTIIGNEIRGVPTHASVCTPRVGARIIEIVQRLLQNLKMSIATFFF